MFIAFSGLRFSAFPSCILRTSPVASRLTRSRLWPPSQQAFRGLETATPSDDNVPYRKQLKDEAKRKRAAGEFKGDPLRKSKDARAERWKLTVGIEVHAQLNTERKLFSREL